MHLKKTRQILKALSDDTRLRVLNLLYMNELTVTEICQALNRNQSIVSKHLTRMRLVGVVGDRRKGLNVYYRLTEPKDKIHQRLINVISECITELKIGKEDLQNLNKLQKKGA
ncbi:ArsR/SmtB family transcription factor [Candidatus Omnitrophota bacterium]